MNTIRKVREGNNVIHTSNDTMGHAFVDHYSSIFISSVDYNAYGLFDVLDTVKRFISNKDKILLTTPYTADKVKTALDTMYLDKASVLMA